MQIDIYKDDRAELLGLFSLADDSIAQVKKYLLLGDVFVARDGAQVIGHVQIIAGDRPNVFEMKSLAVIERQQRQGVGRLLVGAAVAHCRQRCASRLIVSTATADIGNLRFYQRLGFRMVRIVQDVFIEPNGYAPGTMVDGIELRDQVILELDMNAHMPHPFGYNASCQSS